MNTQPRHPKCRALPVELHPDIYFSAIIPRRGRKSKIFCLWSFLWSKLLLCRFRQPGKIPQTKVLQGFVAFRPALSRIPPRHTQSRRATSCATPGYVLFSAAACVCTHFKRKRRFLPRAFSVIPPSGSVRFPTAPAAEKLHILQFA